MSGGGGGGYTPRESSCEELTLGAPLGSPKLAVITGLKPGNLLTLELEATSVKTVLAKTSGGKIAGTITTMTQRLIECMEQGYEFVAEVKQINGAQCQVSIHVK